MEVSGGEGAVRAPCLVTVAVYGILAVPSCSQWKKDFTLPVKGESGPALAGDFRGERLIHAAWEAGLGW